MKLEEQFTKGIEYAKQKQKEAIWLIEIATLEKEIRGNYEHIGRIIHEGSTNYEYYIHRIQSLEKDICSIKKRLNEMKEAK